MSADLAGLPVELIELVASYGKEVENHKQDATKNSEIPSNHRHWLVPAHDLHDRETLVKFEHTVDLRSLRAVCRELNAKTFRLFAETYFKTLKTSLCSEHNKEETSARLHSLPTIDDISKHQALRHHVQTLVFQRPFQDTSPEQGLGLGYHWNQGHPVSPGFELLRNILIDRLVNCRSFCINKYLSEPRDRARYVTSFGILSLLFSLVTEERMNIESLRLGFSDDVILPASSAANGKLWLLRGASDHLAKHQTPAFWDSWADNLTHLSLNLDNHTRADSSSGLYADARLMSVLILGAKNLRKLKLNCPTLMSYQHDVTHLIDYLAAATLPPNIRELSLEGMWLTAEPLCRLILGPSKSLRNLTLENIGLTGDGDWFHTLRQLRDDLPLLDTLCFHRLQGAGSVHVWFCRVYEELALKRQFAGKFDWYESSYSGYPILSAKMDGIRYRGPDTVAVINLLLEKAYVNARLQCSEYRRLRYEEKRRSRRELLQQRLESQGLEDETQNLFPNSMAPQTISNVRSMAYPAVWPVHSTRNSLYDPTTPISF